MRRKNISTSLTTTVIAVALATLLTGARASAQTFTVMHDFLRTGVGGYNPSGNFLLDSSGDLYGVTESGGANGFGTVYELLPQNGGWVEKIVYSFDPSKGDGIGPNGPLIMDSAGNLYGTTSSGPKYMSDILDNGVVYELERQANGSFTRKILYTFLGYSKNSKDGAIPSANLVFDSAGNLYGTTRYGGEHNWGTVFELSPSGSTWTEAILFSFDNSGDSGCQPFGGLVLDSAGNLYGTTNECGANSSGNVYKLSQSGGVWSQTPIYAFDPNNRIDGSTPYSGVVFDSAGNLYGVNQLSGAIGWGTAYELSPQADGTWTETILHSFGSGSDGSEPFNAPVLDSAGNVYGTTEEGGEYAGGAIWEISPGAGGTWTESVLYNFKTKSGYYSVPSSGVILDSLGNLYGVTNQGGTEQGGGAYELIR
jgi:uncharacterized repeat protein (TIGR03803 family)